MTQERPTLDTVAAAAGVSRMTVSNAYNRPDQLSAATRQRVLDVARSLGYAGPDPAGRSLRRGRSGTIGVLLTESLSYAFTDPGLVAFLRGVADELSAVGLAMLLVPAAGEDEGALVRSSIVDAFLVCSLREDDPALLAVRDRRLPYVTVGSPRIAGVPFVGIDNRRGARIAADHLITLGHKRFGVVSLPADIPLPPDARITRARRGFAKRLEGFAAALADAGLPSSALTVLEATTNSSDAAAEAATRLLAARRRPSAVFALSDVLALGTLSAAAALGIAVPSELSVVGFDGIDEGAHSNPPLTTVAQDLRGQGSAAARLVLEVVDGGTPRSPRRSTYLLERGSTAPPHRMTARKISLH
jgi:DNA-binding LacI/PurR family transcriptional regulator